MASTQSKLTFIKTDATKTCREKYADAVTAGQIDERDLAILEDGWIVYRDTSSVDHFIEIPKNITPQCYDSVTDIPIADQNLGQISLVKNSDGAYIPYVLRETIDSSSGTAVKVREAVQIAGQDLLDTIIAQANTNKTDITALKTRLTTDETRITTNEGDIDDLETDLAALEAKVKRADWSVNNASDWAYVANRTHYVKADGTKQRLDNGYLQEDVVVENSLTVGNRATGSTTGTKSLASGASNTASGENSVATGYQSQARGTNSTAMGMGAVASGASSVALGRQTEATNRSSVAIGEKAKSTADYAVATGYETEAGGMYGFTANYKTEANGQAASALGMGTKASGSAQTALGKYNVNDPASSYAVVVGNGSSDTARSNAMTVDWNGNVTTAGKITVGAQPTAANDVTTKTYVDSKIEALDYADTEVAGKYVSEVDEVDGVISVKRTDLPVKSVKTDGTTVKLLLDANNQLSVDLVDGSVAKTKLATDVQASLTKADNAETNIGTLSSLTTSNKATVVGAINSLKSDLTQAETDLAVTVTETAGTGDVLKNYTIKQGSIQIGVISIAKDLVVQSGEIVVDPTGKPAGTYLVLTLNDTNNSKIYINVEDLASTYTAASGATQVQVAISGTNEISATIVDGGISTAKLADGAVTSAKIADGTIVNADIATGTIEKTKLATAVQTSLSKADTALQTSDVVNNLTSTSTTAPLSAAQGKALKDSIDTATTDLTVAVTKQATADTGYSATYNVTQGGTSVGKVQIPDATIADGSVTKAQLVTAVQTSLGKADTALQPTDIVNNLTSTASDKALSAAQGKVLKDAVDDNADDITTLNGAATVSGSVANKIQTAVNALDYADTAVAGQYVSEVDQTDGVISVTRTDLPVKSVDTTGTIVKLALDSNNILSASLEDGSVTKAKLATAVQTTLNQVDTNTTNIATLNGSATTTGSVAKAVKDSSDALETKIGNLSSLATTDKTSLVNAINEINGATGNYSAGTGIAISTGGVISNAGVRTVTASTTGGKVSVNTNGTTADVTVVEIDNNLTSTSTDHALSANQGKVLNDKILALDVADTAVTGQYVSAVNQTDGLISVTRTDLPVKSVDTTGTEVTLALDANKKLSASLATGGIDKTKLATAVQTSLGKADSAVQTVASGSAVGTISVDGTDVAVNGVSAIKTTADANKTDLTTLKGAATVTGSVANTVKTAIEALDVTDTAVSGKYVSAVSETDGKITVTRADLPMAKAVVAGTATGKANTSTALTNGNVFLNVIHNDEVQSSHKITGSGDATVTTDVNGNIVINASTGAQDPYTAGTGIAISATNVISNAGVRSVAKGSNEGTISVNTNGTTANVTVVSIDDSLTSTNTDHALSAAQGKALNDKILALDVTDTAVAGQYVSAVSETDGLVSISRTDLPVKSVDTTGTMVKLALDTNNKLSTSIVDGSITKAKLATAVQTSLGLADTAIQTIAKGSAVGTIAVDGTDVEVNGVSAIKTTADTNKTAIGTLANLSTTAKTDIVSAINETYAAIGSGGTASVVSVSKQATPDSGYSATYNVTQGGNNVGKVQIPISVGTVTSGSANGTISVDGTNVAVNGLAALAYKASATGSVTPTGTVASTFTGTAVNYTPAGTVSAPTITNTYTTSSVTGIDSVGTLATLTTTYDAASEKVTITYTDATLPTKATAVNAVTAVTSTASAPTFTGTQGSVTATGTVASTFTGTASTVTVS